MRYYVIFIVSIRTRYNLSNIHIIIALFNTLIYNILYTTYDTKCRL